MCRFFRRFISVTIPFSPSRRRYQRIACPIHPFSTSTGTNHTIFTSLRHFTATPNEGIPTEKDSFMLSFDHRPVAERVAAMSMARRHSNSAVPLKVFVEELPKVSRDEVFRRGIRVEEWVRESPLLQLVEGADGMHYVRLADGALSILEDVGVVNNNNNKVGDPTGKNNSGVDGGKSNADNGFNSSNKEVKFKTREAESAKQSPHDAVDNDAGELMRLLRHGVLSSTLGKERGNTGSRYMSLNEAYTSLLREASRKTSPVEVQNAVGSLKYIQFINMLCTPRGREEFWILNGKYVAVRNSGELEPPRFVSPQPRTMCASALNNYGGWGAANNVPTRQDVYEILKFVPINWGNFGNLNLPPAIKKRHIRISSTLQWFRRQPFYFELRCVAGTMEIRRSVTLHPEAHGLTPEQAHEQLEIMIAKGEANSLAPVNADGDWITSAEESQQTNAVLKFLTRVCPGYFITPFLLMQRYTKKNLVERELVACARGHPDEFEIIELKYTDTPLMRKRIGADSSRWKDEFLEDLKRYPEDVRGIIALTGRMCSTWDRPQYVYVRLSEEEKLTVGGYEGMMEIFQRHPQIFRYGENFVARVDLSDPLSLREPEPKPDDMTTRVLVRDENPYQTPRDLAVVFHYVAPDGEPSTASFFVQCSSPAMRAVLPPRVVTVLQLFPDLFLCKETSPGVFSIRKVKKMGKGRITNGGVTPPGATTGEGEHHADPDDSFFSDFGGEALMSRGEAIEAVRALIPATGVEASRLLLWASMGVQQAANHHYGGILKLVEANREHFRVQETQETKTIFTNEGG